MDTCENRQANGQETSDIAVQGLDGEQKLERSLPERFQHITTKACIMTV